MPYKYCSAQYLWSSAHFMHIQSSPCVISGIPQLEYAIHSPEGDCRSVSWQLFPVQVLFNNGCSVETTRCWMPHFFLPRTTSFVDLWNVDIQFCGFVECRFVECSIHDLIWFILTLLGYTTWHILKIGFFLLCPDFVPKLKNLKDKIKSKYLLLNIIELQWIKCWSQNLQENTK